MPHLPRDPAAGKVVDGVITLFKTLEKVRARGCPGLILY